MSRKRSITDAFSNFLHQQPTKHQKITQSNKNNEDNSSFMSFLPDLTTEFENRSSFSKEQLLTQQQTEILFRENLRKQKDRERKRKKRKLMTETQKKQATQKDTVRRRIARRKQKKKNKTKNSK